MTPPDHRADPFTASDEAFFEAGLAPDRELMSERPVTLDAEEPPSEEPSAGTARDARRARFVRPVRSTLIALGVLAAVGLVRHLWRPEGGELATGTPAVVHASTNAAPATNLPAELVTDLVAPEEDAPELLVTSMCSGSSSSPPLGATPSAPVAEAALFGPPAPPAMPPPRPASHSSADHAKTKPLTRAPAQHAARPSRPLRKSAPVTKAALLHALRSS